MKLSSVPAVAQHDHRLKSYGKHTGYGMFMYVTVCSNMFKCSIASSGLGAFSIGPFLRHPNEERSWQTEAAYQIIAITCHHLFSISSLSSDTSWSKEQQNIPVKGLQTRPLNYPELRYHHIILKRKTSNWTQFDPSRATTGIGLRLHGGAGLQQQLNHLDAAVACRPEQWRPASDPTWLDNP